MNKVAQAYIDGYKMAVINRPNMSLDQELEDIIYGLEKGYELEPDSRRIAALEPYIDNPQISHILKIWKEGHGLLPSQKSINALKQYFRNIE